MRRYCGFLLVLFLGLPACAAQTVVAFDALFSGPGQTFNQASYSTNAATFLNTYYNPDWDYCAGFAFSTVSNTTDGSWMNPYAAAEAHPRAYAVGYDDGGWHPAPEILFEIPAAPKSVLVNNTTYAALSMRNGSGFNEKFSSGDFFALKLTACDSAGRTNGTLVYSLADFTGTNAFIQTNWTRLDLSALGEAVSSIRCTVESTDPGVPTYFALADFTYAYSAGSDGIAATNPAILCWADRVVAYSPGPVLSNQFLHATNALGPADAASGLGSLAVTGLGDNGFITLAFPYPIMDGPGPDFAVFENAFADIFLELAYVEVSSDGTTFVRFPNHCLEPAPIESGTDPTAYGGLAGKHTQGFGTPFDLRALTGTPGLDVRRVTQVRIVDVLGDGSKLDSYGHPIFDPTPWWGPGDFDLDAVGVLYPRVEISTDPSADAPALPGYTPVLEYKATLDASAWTPAAPAQGPPGFYRWRLVK